MPLGGLRPAAPADRLDPITGRETRTILASGDVPPGRALRSVVVSDRPTATPLQAWLGVPDGEPPYPVVLETHGGPTAATVRQLPPAAQAFLDEGFAVLSLNYRGSTTFGREFEQAIWGRLGELEIEDMAAARTLADRLTASRSRTRSCSPAGRMAAT